MKKSAENQSSPRITTSTINRCNTAYRVHREQNGTSFESTQRHR